MPAASIAETALDCAPWQMLQALLDDCYPRPPRDVFERVLGGTQRRQRLWLANEGSKPVGMVMLSPHSKGGHLDNLAVAPSARGLGIGQQLVRTLLQSTCLPGPAMVSLTTRIPGFFSSIGFQPAGQLADGSTAMLILLPGPSVLTPPVHDHQDC